MQKNKLKKLSNISVQMMQSECTILIPASIYHAQPINLQELISDESIATITIIIESGAQVTIHDVLDYKDVIINRTVNIHIQDSATCTYVYHQNVSEQTVLDDTLNLYAHEDAQANIQMLITGAQESKLSCNFYAQGKRSHITVAGAYSAKDNQKMAIHSLQQHTAKDSTSYLHINGIAADHAQAIYKGLVHIEKDAAGVDAAQHNKNMLLHETAKVQSIPSLQALNNDVQCAHGSAIGQCSQEQLFYLQARGLDIQSAHQLMMHAFLSAPLSKDSLLQPFIKNTINKLF